ncbi:hypothetical protein ABT215_35875 [Streptomyces sp900105755]|uniref:hypothetical protein n=1 Tax=Streptomyces sp. 900105755 TaxID=3154389 RepID=UPI00332E7289
MNGIARTVMRTLALSVVVLGIQDGPAYRAHAAGSFKVLAFHDGTYDAAHIRFDHEANAWFPLAGAQNGFAWIVGTLVR